MKDRKANSYVGGSEKSGLQLEKSLDQSNIEEHACCNKLDDLSKQYVLMSLHLVTNYKWTNEQINGIKLPYLITFQIINRIL